MRGIIKYSMIAISTLLIFFFTSFLVLGDPVSLDSYAADDLFVELVDNKADIGGGYATYKLRIPESYKSIQLGGGNALTAVFDLYKGNGVNYYEYYALRGVPYSYNVTDYQTVCSNYTVENVTESENLIEVERCENVESGWHWNNYTSEEWVLLKSGDTFDVGKEYLVKLVAHWDVHLGEQSIEWFPELTSDSRKVRQDKWAWWNASFNYCRDLIVSDGQANYPAYVNVTDITNMMSDRSDVRFVNATCKNGGSELSFFIRDNSANWFTADVLLDGTQNISIYYNNASIVPSASDYVSTWGSLIHYTPTDENTGTTVYDKVNVNGLINGTADTRGYAAGRRGYAQNFSRVDIDYVNFSDSNSVSTTNAFTIEAWVKLSQEVPVEGEYWVFSKKNTGLVGEYVTSINENEKMRADITSNGGGSWCGELLGNTSLAIGEWYLVDYVYNTTHLFVYLNGTLDAPPKACSKVMMSTFAINYEGAMQASNTHYFDGLIDEVKMYNTSLNASEISNHYASIEPTFSLGIEHAYYSTPLWQNQGQNTSLILSGETVYLYAQGYDDTALDWAWLETNETGSWENKTALDMGDASETWVWSNFTWQNESVENMTVGWRIYYNSTWGNENVTDIMAFNVTLVNITFNITSGEDGSQLTNVNIYCNDSWNASGVSSPYSHGFVPGGYSCTFVKEFYFNETIDFIADNDKNVDVVMSLTGFLSIEEHEWLEAIYDCVIDGDCSLYNLLLDINETTAKTWSQFKRTDQSIVTFENVTSPNVTNTTNLTIDYVVNVPIKEGYGVVEGLQGYDDYLPIRINYWFLDESNTTCYNQGDQTGVESPYCEPLTVQTVGQIDTEVEFTVDLRPDLPEGVYNIVRSIEIDPENVWIDYGQEIIGKISVLASGEAVASLRHTEGVSEEITDVSEAKEPVLEEVTEPSTGFSILTAPNISLIMSIVTFCLVAYLVVTRMH